eukprot:TRINITY_DN64688_c0_g1_i1.p1 TRINITY_DN64688_c0_g1~~TRINITY_DN64688_c0_g1_i1.p1  ORF type:complete len:205 (+),score=25.99 TRINITY_DN64688_c0_g1_i1:45-659(+)
MADERAEIEAAVETIRAELLANESLLTKPIEFKRDTPPIWVKNLSTISCYVSANGNSSCFFLDDGQLLWAVESRRGPTTHGLEMVYWKLADADGEVVGWMEADLLEDVVAVSGRDPPDAVLNLMPEPNHVHALTLKRTGDCRAAFACSNLAGDVVWQSEDKELKIKDIRRMIASQLQLSIRAVQLIGESAQILPDDELAGSCEL